MPHPTMYAKAPLVLVLAEVRHPETPQLSTRQIADIKRALADALPLHRPIYRNDVTVAVGPGAAPVPTMNKIRFETFRSRDGHTSLTVGPESYSLETGTYNGWEGFRRLLERVTQARIDIGRPDGISRFGLRYLDEIRIPGPPEDAPDWSQWLDPQVMAPVPDGLQLQIDQQQAVVQYATNRKGDTLTLRYGAVNGPPAVSGEMRVNSPAPGHYFLLDTDAAWTPSGTPEFDASAIHLAAERLHSDVKVLFESMLTNKLRTEVFDGH